MARRATGRWLTLAFVALPCAAEEPPSLELLLHLAEFSDAAGEPIAPEDAAAMMDAPDAPRAEPPPRDPDTASKPRARAAPPAETPHDRD